MIHIRHSFPPTPLFFPLILSFEAIAVLRAVPSTVQSVASMQVTTVARAAQALAVNPVCMLVCWLSNCSWGPWSCPRRSLSATYASCCSRYVTQSARVKSCTALQDTTLLMIGHLITFFFFLQFFAFLYTQPLSDVISHHCLSSHVCGEY